MELHQKKDKNLTPEEEATGEVGDFWDNTAVDASSKLMVSMVQGPSRDQATTDRLVEDFAERTDHVEPDLVTTDEHATYKPALQKTYGKVYRPRRRKKKGRKKATKTAQPKKMVYATVNKTRECGEVVDVTVKIVFGTESALEKALRQSPCSRSVNTSFVERNNGTARHFNARKQRKTYCFSKRIVEHVAMSWLMLTHYNFCWANRMLQLPTANGAHRERSPAMAAGLASHIWSVRELMGHQVVVRA